MVFMPSAATVHPSHPSRLPSSAFTVCLALLALSMAPCALALDLPLLWTADPDMIMEGAPVVVDLDGDGTAEVITAAYESLIAVDGSGAERWRFDARGRYSTCPAVLEREGQPPLIYVGDNQGQFTCLDGAGTVVWQKDIGSVFGASPALADLNHDGSIELIQPDQAGVVVCLDALTGAAIWSSALGSGCSSPAVGDLDGDGAAEIILSTVSGNVVALDASGKTRWSFTAGKNTPLWALASPILFADAQGQTRIAAASNDGQVFCLDHTGVVVWSRTTRGGVASTLSVADFDADGRADLFAVTQLGVVYRFDEAGRVLWDIDTQGRSLASGAIVDLDGDGALDYLLCTQQGNLLAFNQAGEVTFNYQFDNRTINMTPAIGDLVPQRPGLEFAVTGGESGKIFCFGTGATLDSAAPWRTYRADNRMTGAWFGLTRHDTIQMTPENLAWDQLRSGEELTFHIVNPSAGDGVFTAEASCVRPDGARQVSVGKVVGREGLLKLPVTISAPGVHHFAWSLKDAANQTVASGARDLTLTPWQNDLALARRAVLALQQAIGNTPGAETSRDIRGALFQESSAITTEADALTSIALAAPGASVDFVQSLEKRLSALNLRAQCALALAALASTMSEDVSPGPLVPFEGATWENRDVNLALPATAAPLRIARCSVTGEHEPVSVKLFNSSLDPVQCTARVKVASGGPAVRILEVKSVATNQGQTAWDPMVDLKDGLLTIPALETRELWLDIDLASVKPGPCALDLVLNSASTEHVIPIQLDVLPFQMAGFGAMRLCCWATCNDDAYRDLLAHGNNVFVGNLPPVTVGTGDALELDFTALDKLVAALAGHDVYLLLGGIPDLAVPMESEDYARRLGLYYDALIAHLSAQGIDEAHVALYPHDEPGGNGWDTVKHYVLFGRQALKARPGIKFYVNGGGDLAMFEAMNEVAAIWSPGFNMLSESTPEMNFLRKSGKILWSYDCTVAFARPIGANTKTINVAAQYRLAAPFTMNYGATGLGYWCYNVGPSMWDPIEMEYPLVYANPDGTHNTSRRWEAVREGMEDARILLALRDKLGDPTLSADVKDRIRHLLEVTLPEISNQAMSQLHLGVARYAIDASNNDATVTRLRDEMLDCAARVMAPAK